MISRFITLTYLLLASVSVFSSSLLERSLGQVRQGSETSSDFYQELAYQQDEEKLKAGLLAMAEKLNRRAPISISESTRFDQATTSEKKFTYHYTLVSQKNSPELKLKMAQYLETKLRNEYCFAPQMRYLKTNNVSLEYFYSDFEGTHIISRVASGKSCD